MVESIVYVSQLIDRAAVDPHAQLHLGMTLQGPTDLNRALNRRFRTVEENQRHPVAYGKAD